MDMFCVSGSRFDQNIGHRQEVRTYILLVINFSGELFVILRDF